MKLRNLLTVLGLILTITWQFQAQNNTLSELLVHGFDKAPCTHDGCKKQCFSMALHQGRQNLETLSPEARDVVESAAMRPQFQGTEQLATLGIFVFHYSVDGPPSESIDPTDNDFSGFPDYLEFMAFEFLAIAEEYHEVRGWTYPPFDGDELNDAYYDVYIGGGFAGDNVYGYVAEDQVIGDNPNSTHLLEKDAATSYMVMRNEYNDFPGTTEKNIQVTAAHEYLHAVQYGYWTDMEIWMFEGSAAWAEEYFYPGLDDNFQYLGDVFQYSDIAMNINAGEVPQLDGHWYSTWLFFQYLTEHYGVDIIKKVFEAGIQEYSFPALDRVLNDNGTSILNVFASYYVAAGLSTADNDAAPFDFKRGEDYKNATGGMKVESQFLFDGGTPVYFNSQSDGNGILMRTACDYHYFQSQSNFRLDAVQGNGNGEILFLLVKGIGLFPNLRGIEIEQLAVNGNQRLAIIENNDDYDFYVLMTLRADFDSEEISSLQYEFQVSPIGGVATEDISDKYNIEAFPTVVTDKLYIDLNDYTGDYTAEVFDVNGSSVAMSFDKREAVIQTGSISAGTYMLVLYDDEQRIIHQSKFIRQ